jgi:hypothetical protein
MALALELVLDQLRVTVWPDRHRRRVRKQMDAMVVAVWWWQPCRCVEDIVELLEKQGQEVCPHHGVGRRCSMASHRALPDHAVTVSPAANASPREVPQDGSQGAQQVHTEDHVEAIQRDHEQVEDELLGVDEDTSCTTDVCGSDTVTIGDSDAKAWLR